jgi:hypothetical protein
LSSIDIGVPRQLFDGDKSPLSFYVALPLLVAAASTGSLFMDEIAGLQYFYYLRAVQRRITTPHLLASNTSVNGYGLPENPDTVSPTTKPVNKSNQLKQDAVRERGFPAKEPRNRVPVLGVIDGNEVRCNHFMKDPTSIIERRVFGNKVQVDALGHPGVPGSLVGQTANHQVLRPHDGLLLADGARNAHRATNCKHHREGPSMGNKSR